MKALKYLILSPFAGSGTQNSGDDLIVKSLIKLLKFFKNDIEYDIISIAKSTPDREKTFKNTDIKKYKALLVPGFRVSIEGSEILDTRLKYIENAIMENIPVFCLGSSWCAYPGNEFQTGAKINPKERALLRYIINDRKSIFTVRDVLTGKFVRKNGLECILTGDIGLYDPVILDPQIGINENVEVKTIGISLPHNIYHYSYVERLKEILEGNGYAVYRITHQKLIDKKYFDIDASGEAEALDEAYKNIDLHVGFRLHGHVYFLRNRRPSFLLAEDGRGNGHLKTFETANVDEVGLYYGVHCVPEYINKYSEKFRKESIILDRLGRRANLNLQKICHVLKMADDTNYRCLLNTYNQIDYLYTMHVKDIIKMIVEG